MTHTSVKPTLFTCLILLFSAACGDATNAEQAVAPGALPPGGGGGDNSLQKTQQPAAPEGQQALTVETLAEGLSVPWSITFLPDGDMLVTERPGRVRLIRDGVLAPDPVAGVPEVLAYNQGGLFDVMPHPDFSANRVIFLAYAHGTEGSNTLRIARAKFVDDEIIDLQPIYDATPQRDTGHHYGGRIVWGPDGKLYVSSGEASRYKEKAQDMSTSYGAVIRINEDGSIPDDNPDFGDGALPELFSKGHRNPQGFAYDAERGIFWENEHGPRGGDEINIVRGGANYGWPAASYGIDYNGALITPFTEYEGTEQPFHYWTPSIAPSGLAVYRGEMFEGWDGDLLVGAMAGAALHRLILEGEEVVGQERYLLGERIRDVRVGPDGAIYVASEARAEDADGKILRVTPQ